MHPSKQENQTRGSFRKTNNFKLHHLQKYDMKSFKTSLKRFLYHHSFYPIEEYYKYNDDKGM